MTLTLPKRDEAGTGDKVICIDVPERLRGLIPEDLRKDAEFLSHTFYRDELDCTPEEMVRRRYEHYIKDGRLIITTRLHAALPCFAAGLPVVFFKDEYSYRFAGVDAVVPFYSQDDYGKIDWDPAPLDLSEHKSSVIEVARQRILDAYEQNRATCELSERLENKERKPYFVEFLDNSKAYLERTWPKDEPVDYVLWGITQIASALQDYIEREFPQARLVGVVDKSKRTIFRGVESCPKEELVVEGDPYYLVCAYAAVGEASDWFKKEGIRRFYQTADDDYTHKAADDDMGAGVEK